ncbi:MAG: protein kinase [Polyangiaceae bacterium]
MSRRASPTSTSARTPAVAPRHRHRDLSPQNVMVSFTGEVKIIDFGTARGQNRRCHTVAGVVFAKPGYVAPEVANGDSGDARVDLYALGIMLWELCAGRRFLEGDAQHHLARVARNEMSPPPIAASSAPPRASTPRSPSSPPATPATSPPAPPPAISPSSSARPAPSPPASAASAPRRAPHGLSLPRRAPRLAEGVRPPRRPGPLPQARAPRRPAARPRAEEALAPRPPTPPRHHHFPPRSREAREAREAPLRARRHQLQAPRGSATAPPAPSSRSSTSPPAPAPPSRSSPAKVPPPRRHRALPPRRRALSLLDHPNLVRVHDTGVLADGRPFCAMGLCGETLQDTSPASAAPYREALGFATKILSGGLEIAHAAGLVHRDFSPANVFLPGGGLKLLDFGLAGGRTPSPSTSPKAAPPARSSSWNA